MLTYRAINELLPLTSNYALMACCRGCPTVIQTICYHGNDLRCANMSEINLLISKSGIFWNGGPGWIWLTTHRIFMTNSFIKHASTCSTSDLCSTSDFLFQKHNVISGIYVFNCTNTNCTYTYSCFIILEWKLWKNSREEFNLLEIFW